MPNLSTTSAKSMPKEKKNGALSTPVSRKYGTRGKKKGIINQNFIQSLTKSQNNSSSTSNEIQPDIISDAGNFKVDETPVAVPVHSPSTPHRINMPIVQAEDINDDEIIVETDKKIEIISLTPIQPKTKKVGAQGRRKLIQNNTNRSPNSTNTESTNRKLTEFFPVRRSVRKSKKTVLEEKQRDMENKVLCQVEEGLEVRYFPGKGRGIVTTREFRKGEFVVEYMGELIDQVTAKKREQTYAQDQNTGCYMYYFQHRNHQYCVDATAETNKLGRLVNHSRNGNLVARVVEVGNLPHLVLTAKEDIPIGVEISYDYGDRSRESIRNHPWLAL
ncbi:histone-lysine N-methyltransferase Set8 [Prorops nasuta]|uniref:histone-lysine N-methyltransferase Set8 n=1 Tax=Prorops nasuta TaxID=863751 RepID=UPI0034CF84F8